METSETRDGTHWPCTDRQAVFLIFLKIYNLFLFYFGCTGSLLLHTDFLQLQQTGAALSMHGLLTAVVSLVAEQRF